jgi:hypothetical protein
VLIAASSSSRARARISRASLRLFAQLAIAEMLPFNFRDSGKFSSAASGSSEAPMVIPSDDHRMFNQR